MFDFLDNVKKNLDKSVPQLELYINIITTVLLCVMVYLMCLLLISYNNNESNDSVFHKISIIGIIMLIMFYVKNMSRINLFMKSQWVSLDKQQRSFFVITMFTLLMNIGIGYYRKRAIANDFNKSIYMLTFLSGIILSLTVAKTVDGIMNLRDYVKNNHKNQVYSKLNKELSYAKLNEIKMYIEKPL